ncbi:MAG: hypothetical protein WD872_03760 [Pirellulaceae bacterium]
MKKCQEGNELRSSSRCLERGLAWLAVALPILVLFGPVLFSDRLFAMRDAGHYYYPLFQWSAAEWGAGRIPLWNPLENGGTAIHADPTASLFYPGKLLFALPVDFALRFKLYVVGHVVLCAVAAYWLARHWQGSRYAAALAALSYACGGSVVFQHCNVVYLVGAAWLPLAAGLLDDLLRGGRWQAAIALGGVLAMMVLGGDPQMAYHAILLGGLYGVVLLASGRGQPPAGVAFSSWRSVALLAAAAFVGFLLAAIQILPAAEATAASERARFEHPRSLYELPADAGNLQGLIGQPTPGTHHATVYDFSVAPWRWAEAIWPNCGGRMFPTHRRWFSLLPGEGRIWSPSLYLGLLPLVLGLGAMRLRSADPRIRWLSWLTILFFVGSLGTFGVGWLARNAAETLGFRTAPFGIGDPVGGIYWLFVVTLPKYVLFRYPAKLLVVAAFGISQLAAVGWDRAACQPPRWMRRVLVGLGVVSGAAAAAALVVAQFVTLGVGVTDRAFGPFDSRGAWMDLVAALLHGTVVALLGAWLLKQVSGGREPPESTHLTLRFRQSALLVLCAAELTLANRWLVPTAPARLWREPAAVASAIERGNRGARIYRAGRWWPRDFALHGSADRLNEIVRWERATLAGRYALLDQLTVAGSPVGLKSAEYERLLDALRARENDLSSPAARELLRQLDVQYLILPPNKWPDFADRIASSGLPPDATLWLIDDALSETAAAERPAITVFQPGKFYRGASIGAASWGALIALGVTLWLRLRRAKSARLQSP